MARLLRMVFHHGPAFVLLASMVLFSSVNGHADISTDGTLGPVRNLSGPAYRIGPELGTTVGTNLFHSFDHFNINSSESATFTGPDRIERVISRVTGGSVSTINGLLRSEIGTADFFFINPAGVIFGPNARVDVPAAFHIGTADELRFAEGRIYSAVHTSASTLTAEAPESFGYLGGHRASLVVNCGKLEFAPGSSVSLSGGDVTIKGENTDIAKVSVPGGELRISAVGNASEQILLKGDIQTGAGILRVDHAQIKTSGNGGGSLLLGSGRIALTDGMVAADNTGRVDAEILNESNGITLKAADLLSVTNGGQISCRSLDEGDAGRIYIEAGNLLIDGSGTEKFTRITSDALFSGNAGAIMLKVDGLVEALNGSYISTAHGTRAMVEM